METQNNTRPKTSFVDKLKSKKAGLPLWAWILIVAIVIVAIVIAVIFIAKRKSSSALTSREAFTRLNKGNGNPMQAFVDDWISSELGGSVPKQIDETA